MKVLALLAFVASAAADVSHILGNAHHHDHHHEHHPEHRQEVHVHQFQTPFAVRQESIPIQNQKPIAIIKQVQETSGFGDYKFNFETENGIQVQEEAVQKNRGAEGEAKQAQGSYSYTGPDGQLYTVTWIADENGYRASGAHLPQAPEIPAEIQKALDLIASQPQQIEQ